MTPLKTQTTTTPTRLVLPASHTALSTLRSTWKSGGHIRLTPALPEAFAVACLRALRGTPHTPSQDLSPTAGHQLWRYGWEPGTDCTDHLLCDLGHILNRTLTDPAVSRSLFGLDLVPTQTPFISTELRKSTFADAWNERGASAPDACAIAFALYLTTASWPVTWGGHLERLPASNAHTPIDAHAPTWNALDLFDLTRPHTSWRRLPLVTEHIDGYIIMNTFSALHYQTRLTAHVPKHPYSSA